MFRVPLGKTVILAHGYEQDKSLLYILSGKFTRASIDPFIP